MPKPVGGGFNPIDPVENSKGTGWFKIPFIPIPIPIMIPKEGPKPIQKSNWNFGSFLSGFGISWIYDKITKPKISKKLAPPRKKPKYKKLTYSLTKLFELANEERQFYTVKLEKLPDFAFEKKKIKAIVPISLPQPITQPRTKIIPVKAFLTSRPFALSRADVQRLRDAVAVVMQSPQRIRKRTVPQTATRVIDLQKPGIYSRGGVLENGLGIIYFGKASGRTPGGRKLASSVGSRLMEETSGIKRALFNYFEDPNRTRWHDAAHTIEQEKNDVFNDLSLGPPGNPAHFTLPIGMNFGLFLLSLSLYPRYTEDHNYEWSHMFEEVLEIFTPDVSTLSMSEIETDAIWEFLAKERVFIYSLYDLSAGKLNPGDLTLVVNRQQFPPGLHPINDTLLCELVQLDRSEVDRLRNLGLTWEKLRILYDPFLVVNTVADLENWLIHNP